MAQGDQVRAGDLGLRAARRAAARLEDLPLEEVERMLIQKALERYDGNVSQAAKALGLSRSALYRRLAASWALTRRRQAAPVTSRGSSALALLAGCPAVLRRVLAALDAATHPLRVPR